MELDSMTVVLSEREPVVVVVGVGATVCCVPFTGDVVAEVWLSDPFAAALVALVAVLLVAPAPAPLDIAVAPPDVAVAVAGAKVPVEPSVLE